MDIYGLLFGPVVGCYEHCDRILVFRKGGGSRRLV